MSTPFESAAARVEAGVDPHDEARLLVGEMRLADLVEARVRRNCRIPLRDEALRHGGPRANR